MHPIMIAPSLDLSNDLPMTCPIPCAGLDMSALQDIHLSPSGQRLVVGDPADDEYDSENDGSDMSDEDDDADNGSRDVSDQNTREGTALSSLKAVRGAGAKSRVARKGRQAPRQGETVVAEKVPLVHREQLAIISRCRFSVTKASGDGDAATSCTSSVNGGETSSNASRFSFIYPGKLVSEPHWLVVSRNKSLFRCTSSRLGRGRNTDGACPAATLHNLRIFRNRIALTADFGQFQLLHCSGRQRCIFIKLVIPISHVSTSTKSEYLMPFGANLPTCKNVPYAACAAIQPLLFGNSYEEEGSLDRQASRDQDSMTITTVAVAAFAGGWFCALLTMITVACWSELSMLVVGGGDLEGDLGATGNGERRVAAWLLRVFADDN